MNKLTTRIAAIVIVVSTAVSSRGSESRVCAPSLEFSKGQLTLPVPSLVSSKCAFDPTEVAQYRALAIQSPELSARKSAGASKTTKTVLIVASAVVVVVGVAVLVATHLGKDVPIGNFLAQ